MRKMLNAVVIGLLLIWVGSVYAVNVAPLVNRPPETAYLNVAKCTDKPEYPKNSARNEETGTVIIRFLISVEGRVIKAEIERSSGFRDLDNAAVVYLSACDHFKPGIVDGKPVESWARVSYTWAIEYGG